MPSFKDARGLEWLVKIDGPKIREVREACKLDLVSTDGKAFELLENDPCLLVDVLWVLCRGQNTGVTDAQFGESLVGDPIEHATKALIDAVTDFFPSRKRSLLRSLADKQAAVMAKGTEMLMQKLNDPTLETRMVQAAEARLTRELQQLLKDSIGANGATTSADTVASDQKV